MEPEALPVVKRYVPITLTPYAESCIADYAHAAWTPLIGIDTGHTTLHVLCLRPTTRLSSIPDLIIQDTDPTQTPWPDHDLTVPLDITPAASPIPMVDLSTPPGSPVHSTPRTSHGNTRNAPHRSVTRSIFDRTHSLPANLRDATKNGDSGFGDNSAPPIPEAQRAATPDANPAPDTTVPEHNNKHKNKRGNKRHERRYGTAPIANAAPLADIQPNEGRSLVQHNIAPFTGKPKYNCPISARLLERQPGLQVVFRRLTCNPDKGNVYISRLATKIHTYYVLVADPVPKADIIRLSIGGTPYYFQLIIGASAPPYREAWKILHKGHWDPTCWIPLDNGPPDSLTLLYPALPIKLHNDVVHGMKVQAARDRIAAAALLDHRE